MLLSFIKSLFHGTGAERKQWYLEKKRGKRNKQKRKKQRKESRRVEKTNHTKISKETERKRTEREKEKQRKIKERNRKIFYREKVKQPTEANLELEGLEFDTTKTPFKNGR
jgi:hypothetical protein